MSKKYPKIDDNDFYRKINDIYRKYKIPSDKKTLKEICFPKKFQLQTPQQFVANYINPDTPYKSILVYHRIGAGKTCTAVNVAEKWKHLREIIVVVPAALKGNFRNELRSECAGNEYLTDNERKKLRDLHPTDDEYKQIIKESDKRIDKYYKIYSYNKFVELSKDGKINFKKKVLIIDEVQNMVSEYGSFYKILYDEIHNAPNDLRIVLLSATPIFDKPIEIALTMNLLRLNKEIPIGNDFVNKFMQKHTKNGISYYTTKNIDKFKDLIKGHVSYFRGAPPYVFPERILKYVKCKMMDFQYKSYLTVKNNELDYDKNNRMNRHRGFTDGDILELPNNFFIGTRKISNIAFPNKGTEEDGLKSLEGRHLEMNNLQKYSIKFYKIMRKIKKCKGTVFVYSNFKEYGGIKSFVKVLQYYGYKDYTQHSEGNKRYAIWSGDEPVNVKEEIRTIFNQKSNVDGSKLKILLGSPSIKEGVSLLRVQQVHIMEPYWNISRLEQIIGRAIRFCSHRDVPADLRQVKVYIYIATHDEENETVDEYIQRLAFYKNSLISEFELALKESAVDCTLNYNANVYKGEELIQCQK